jgi:hypothetical protein
VKYFSGKYNLHKPFLSLAKNRSAANVAGKLQFCMENSDGLALELLEGKVVGLCSARQRHQEFLKFLHRLDQEFCDAALHRVSDKYVTHKTSEVKAWLKRHLRFVSTSSS